jgi:hypothetical protein
MNMVLTSSVLQLLSTFDFMELIRLPLEVFFSDLKSSNRQCVTILLSRLIESDFR